VGFCVLVFNQFLDMSSCVVVSCLFDVGEVVRSSSRSGSSSSSSNSCSSCSCVVVDSSKNKQVIRSTS
jgi:hypothetical protein